MQSRRIVVDANILIRAVLGSRVREIIELHCESTAFYVAEANFEEAAEYLAELGSKRGIPTRHDERLPKSPTMKKALNH